MSDSSSAGFGGAGSSVRSDILYIGSVITSESPHVARAHFGGLTGDSSRRGPVTLSALEDPNLLPTNTPEEKRVREMADTLAGIHRTLQGELESLKDAEALARPATNQGRSVQIGDRVWLTYSDSERARYIRKHGHGRAWRHPYAVEAIKPHAVRLHVPKDGSVPDVLPWQSLRKCAFAAPYFHDEELPLPVLDPRGNPTVDDPESGQVLDDAHSSEPPAMAEADELYDIERVVRAERIGKGWRLFVKWSPQGDNPSSITPEPLSKILQTVRDPEILQQIKECQETYDAENPTRRPAGEAPEVPEPTRIQPARERRQATRFAFSLSVAPHDEPLLANGLRTLRKSLNARILTVTSQIDELAWYLPHYPGSV